MSGLSSLTSRNLRPAAVALVALAVLASWPVAAHAAGLLIADGGFGGRLEIKEQQVHVTINNGVAVTDVEQIFVNTENRVVEALYTFPVPSGASVSNFSMWIDGREMIGEVVEKERAGRSTRATRPCGATRACSSESTTNASTCGSFRSRPAPSSGCG